jgi:hypothetical protein
MAKNDPYDPDRYSGGLPPLDPPTPPDEKPKKPRGEHSTGFILIPVQVRLRLRGAPATAWATMACLLDLEFEAKVKGGLHKLSNQTLAIYGVSRDQKRAALDELVKRGLVTYTQHGRASPLVKLWVHGLK